MALCALALLLVLSLLATNVAATLPLCRVGLGCLDGNSNCCCCAARRAAKCCCCARPAPHERKGFTGPKCSCRGLPALPLAPARKPPVIEPPQWAGVLYATSLVASFVPGPPRLTHAADHNQPDTGPPLRVLFCTWRI